ncbi:MAG: hypothetical protein ACI4JA_07975 [Oscillospiraceae bacterium]
MLYAWRYTVYANRSLADAVPLETDDLSEALSFVKKNSDKIHRFKIYDRRLKTFDIDKIKKAAEQEKQENKRYIMKNNTSAKKGKT